MTNILIIEDEDKIRTSLKRILEFSDFDVVDAPNGRVGLEMAAKDSPDLILCDIMMPDMNGHQVLQALNNNNQTTNIPFIFLTAKSDISEIREGMDLGADDYLTKPVKTETLLNCIRTRLDKQQKQKQQSDAKLDAVRTTISRSMPHELNTPLNGIIGYADLLTMHSDPEVQEMSSMILESGERLDSMIKKFLMYASLELAMQSPSDNNVTRQAIKFNIILMIEHVANMVASRTQREADLRLDLVPGALTISSFFSEKLLEELIDNAFKFSEPGTPVIITNCWDDNCMFLTIQDQGRGMQPGQISDVDAYVQFERRIYEQQGIGLGLTIAKYVAELQGGCLRVESQPEVGTTINVELPLTPSSGNNF